MQPFEQLINAFRRMGQDEEADEIAIYKNQKLNEQKSFFKKFGNYFLYYTVKYGYRPWRAIIYFIIPIILLGWILFGLAYNRGEMFLNKSDLYLISKKESLIKEHPHFNALIYSLDVFIPFVDLNQRIYWEPFPKSTFGKLCLYYYWFHIFAGWILSALVAISFIGLIRRE